MEERFDSILKVLEKKKAVTVTELTELLDISESTIRRDLTALHNMGRLNKVHGGATTRDSSYSTDEAEVSDKYDLNTEEKNRIAAYAASLIEEGDFVYLDAGTTTEAMIEYISERNATFFTNGITHGVKLAARGFKTFILGGEIRKSTEAVIGMSTISSLKRYNFSKGFFGTNGISIHGGFSTPDVAEAAVKTAAMEQCENSYVLADPSKFKKVLPVTFGKISSADIITTRLPDKKYKDHTEIAEVDS